MTGMLGRLREYGLAVGANALCTAFCSAVSPFVALTDLVMVYLVGTLAVALRGRRGPAVFSSFLSVLCFNFFFVPPRFTFDVEHPQYVVTFLVMLAVALTISHLALRIRTQAEAAKSSELAAETERLRSSLLSAVSHELKTPLTAIIGSAGSLLQAPDAGGGHRRELLDNIREEAQRLARLVHNLIETTRFESGGVRLRKEPYPIEDVVGTALERLDKPLTGREVRTDLPEDLPLIPVDPVLMELVFVNLIENALRHAPESSAIEIAARQVGGRLEATVADRGPGLRTQPIERVFEKFYRAGPAPGGAGLGLAICKAVVEAHGGSIQAENRVDGGALFRLSLPLRGEP
ncbi:MAG TPA: sensor histidine kinase [Elusimicrobia bacterium]|nr:sensor histidine kinase [Elusimicrobiota bacterium]